MSNDALAKLSEAIRFNLDRDAAYLVDVATAPDTPSPERPA